MPRTRRWILIFALATLASIPTFGHARSEADAHRSEARYQIRDVENDLGPGGGPMTTGSRFGSGSAITVMSGLAGLLVGFSTTLWWIRKQATTQETPGRVEVVGRTSLAPKHAVFQLRSGNRVWLIGIGPQSAPSRLAEWIEEPMRTPIPREVQ